MKFLFQLFVALALAGGQQALAKDKKDSEKKKHVEKVSGPSVEDYATFFAKKQKDVTPEVQEQADALRLKTIESITSLLESPKLADSKKFELLLRLGETYVERHDYLRGKEIDSSTKQIEEWQKAGAKGKAPETDNTQSKQELTKAVNSFRKLVTEFPKHPRTDQALFALAQTLSRLGNDNATMYYEQLLKTYPDSPLVPDAYLALGEHHFDRHQIPAAIDNYKNAMKYKEHKAYPYSVYKLGWAYYDAGGSGQKDFAENYKKSVAAFKLVIKLADLPQFEKGAVSLKDEAIKDLILVWADAEDVDSAWDYFRSIGASDMFYKMLERLGYIYVDQGKNKLAIKVFNRLLKESPLRESNPSVYRALAEIYDLDGQPAKTVESLKNMQKLYLGKTEWTAAHADNKEKDSIAAASEIVQKDMHRYGALYHDNGQKTHSKESLHLAAELYSAYLKSFAGTPQAYEIRFYLAEILYSFKEYDEATDHYLIVSRQDQDKYRADAARNAVAAMNTLVNKNKYPKLPERGHVPSELTIPGEKKKLVEAIDNCVKILPADKEAGAMRFTAADIMFDYGHYPDAIQRFAEITKAVPGTKQSDGAVKIIIAYYLDQEAWQTAIEWSKTFIKQQGLLNKNMDEFVKGSLRTSLFKHGLALEKSNKRKEAATVFMDFQKEFPNDDSADKALYNASVNFYKLGDLDAALNAGTMLLDKYPNSEVRPDVMLTVGQTYEAIADFNSAGTQYQRFATDFPQDKRAPGILYNAGIFMKGMDQLKKAEGAFRQFLKLYPKDADAADAMFQLATVEEKQNNARGAIETYSDLAKRTDLKDEDRRYFASVKAAALMVSGQDVATGRKTLEKIQETFSKNPGIKAFSARQLLAASLFKMYETDMTAYSAMLVDDGSKVEQLVTKKNNKLLELATKYQGVINLGSAEFTVASLYRLGELHEELAAALFRAPAPAGASQSDIDKFKSQLEKVAFPLRNDANKYFESAYEQCKDIDTFTDWTRITHDKMVELHPQKYKKFDPETVQARYLSHRIQLSEATRGLADQ
jgi:TolA-binding protein